MLYVMQLAASRYFKAMKSHRGCADDHILEAGRLECSKYPHAFVSVHPASIRCNRVCVTSKCEAASDLAVDGEFLLELSGPGAFQLYLSSVLI